MPPLVRPLTLFQWGKEVTRGTAVAATSKIAVEGIDFAPTDELYRPNLAKGLLLPHSGDEVPVMRGTTWSLKDTPVVYSQQQNWLAMAVKGGVAAVGAADPYTWTYTRSLTADPAPTTYTLERRLTDGTNNQDNEWAYCFLTQIGWTIEQGQPLKFSAEGVARHIQASTLTPAMAMPTIEIPVAALSQMWIDATWANLGTTLVSGELQKAEIQFKTGLKPAVLVDGRTDLDFSTYIIDGDAVGLDVTIDVLLSASRAASALAAAEAGTIRAVRLKATNAGTGHSMQFDMLLKFDAASFFEVGDKDGQVVGQFKLRETTDGTNLFQVVLLNAINTLT